MYCQLWAGYLQILQARARMFQLKEHLVSFTSQKQFDCILCTSDKTRRQWHRYFQRHHGGSHFLITNITSASEGNCRGCFARNLATVGAITSLISKFDLWNTRGPCLSRKISERKWMTNVFGGWHAASRPCSS